MDQFRLNPSHGISSPWPSSSNLHVFAEEKEQNASIYVWFGGRGATRIATSTKPRIQDDFEQDKSMQRFTIDPSCLHWTVPTHASCL